MGTISALNDNAIPDSLDLPPVWLKEKEPNAIRETFKDHRRIIDVAPFDCENSCLDVGPSWTGID